MFEEPAKAAPFLPQLIIQGFTQIIDELHRYLIAAGYDDLRPTHCLNVFRLMDCDGTRPTTLARRAGMTPQAMSELVGHLEQSGYVRRVPDPSDGRGRVVVYADRGMAAAEVTAAYFAEVEDRWGALVGPERLQDAMSVLDRILTGAPDRRAATAGVPAP